MAQGTTVEEAEANLNDFRIDYIEHLLEHNLPVQPPASKVTSITGIVNKDAVVRVSLEESILKPIDEADIQRDDHETIVLPM